MKTLTCTRTHQPIALIQQLATSGEGEIWQTQQAGTLAKIYYAPTPERIRKLEAMVAHPPQDPNAHIQHISFAWPQSLLADEAGTRVGFLMPAIANAVDLLEVYNPLRRQMALPGFNWYYLHAVAMNVASIVWAIHRAGYVLGDLKPQNILVNNCALPSIIDTDSFQVRHPQTQELYRCPVGSEGFTPAELMGQDLAAVEQTEIHDRFRLGVILYLLLFGDHPFKGRWTGTGDSPDPNVLLQKGWWPYTANSPIQPSRLTVPLGIVHPVLQQCFLRCFNDGHHHPHRRPAPSEWVTAFQGAIADLKRCRQVKNHYFRPTHGHCYWCARKKDLGVDVFPVVPTLSANPILRQWQTLTPRVGSFAQQVQKNLSLQGLKTLQHQAFQSIADWQKPLGQSVTTFMGGAWLHHHLPLPATGVVTSPSSFRSPSIPATPVAPPPPVQHLAITRFEPMVMLGGVAALFTVLVILIKSELEGEELTMTLVGGGLCIALVILGSILLKIKVKSQN
ncbi:MAG: hypothetical protein WCD18_27840 [Thermosynechococcaceae cyanobacterium]